MSTKSNALDVKIEIGLEENKEWDDAKLASVKAFIKEQSAKTTPEQTLKTQILAIQYQMEQYLDEDIRLIKKPHELEAFLKTYLGILNLSLKRFALSIDTTDGNLKKYLSGERKFNIDLAMKFGHFFHTRPDLWLKIQLKNELIVLNKEKRQVSRYKKYDYRKVLAQAS